YFVGEGLYSARRPARLGLENLADVAALVSIAERCFDRRAQDEGHDGCDEQGREIFEKQRATRARRRAVGRQRRLRVKLRHGELRRSPCWRGTGWTMYPAQRPGAEPSSD